MALTSLKMPQLGESVTEGTVDRWLKKEGDLVKRDEPLVEIVTDKVNAEVPSPFEGRLVRIQVAEGATVPIGTSLAEMEVEGAADTPSPQGGEGRGGAKAAKPPPTPTPPLGGGGHPEAKPREELFRISAVRRQIAEHMVRSKATSPHAWGMREVDMSALVAYREANKAGFAERHGISLTYLPFIIQVVCEALKENPFLNSSWTEEGILVKNYYNIGVAVALPDALIVPVLKDADQRGLLDLARGLVDLSTRARTKHLKPEDVRDGTFTVNNTGAIGSILGMAIINQPQAAILSTEKIVKRAVVVDDQIVIRPIMNLSMSFDHRIVDGLQAGHFLDSMQRRLEGWTPASIQL